jgi:hypothetical protein
MFRLVSYRSDPTAPTWRPAFLANPIGVPINPESYAAAWQKGASLQEMHERSYAGEFAEGAAMIAID